MPLSSTSIWPSLALVATAIFSPLAAGLGDGLAPAVEEFDEPPHAASSAAAAMPNATTFPRMKTDTEAGYGARLLGGYVRRRNAAVDRERRAVDIARLVAGKKERCIGDLTGLREAPHRQVHAPALVGAWVCIEDPHQKRRLDGSGAECVDAHSLSGELHSKLTAHRQHGALRGGVRDLRGRRAHQGYERRDVDHRTAACFEQVRYAELAAQEHALRVHRVHPAPRARPGGEDRVVVRGHDARVVVEPIDPAVTLGGRLVHRLHALGVADVRLKIEGVPALGGRLLARFATHVRDADLSPLG